MVKKTEVKAEEPWRQDGLRFVAALQDVNDPLLYKDFFESESFSEAKQAVDEAAEKHQRSALVFDRKHIESYKKVIETKKAEESKPVVHRRGKKVALKKDEIPEAKNNNDFFD